MSSSEGENEIDFEAEAEKILLSLLPQVSHEKYQKTYSTFKEWCTNKNVSSIDEKILMVYFSNEINDYAPTTTWTIFSMLKATLSVKDNIDISRFNNLRALVKRKGEGYRPKKSEILKLSEFYQFLKEAPDEVYLPVKVALIVGVFGACRRVELVDLSVDDIEYIENKNEIKIDVPKTKNKIARQFVIDRGADPDVNFVEIFRKYAALRPANTQLKRFFMCYRNGKCVNQPIGINTIGGYPQKIASFLKLPYPEKYTGHCFRRTSASFLADSGVNISIIKRHGGWKSDRVAEGYVENSLNNKRRIAANIIGRKIQKTDEHTVTSAALQQSEPVQQAVEPSVSIASSSATQNVTIISQSEAVNSTNEQFTVTSAAVVKSVVKSGVSPLNSFGDLHNCTFNFYQK